MAWSIPQVPVTGWGSAELLPLFVDHLHGLITTSVLPGDLLGMSPLLGAGKSLVVLGSMGGCLAGSANMLIE